MTDLVVQQPEEAAFAGMMPRYHTLALYLLNGYTVGRISGLMGISESQIKKMSSDSRFLVELRKLQRKREKDFLVSDELQSLSRVALETIEKTMISAKSEGLRFKAAQDVMDRAGYMPIQKSMNVNINQNVATETMTDSELKKLVLSRIERMNQSIKNREQELAEASTIDVEFEPVGCPPSST